MMRTGHSPANNAAFNNIALAIILTNGFDRIPAATDHYEANRDKVIGQILLKRPRRP